jgi:hypothetical protein
MHPAGKPVPLVRTAQLKPSAGLSPSPLCPMVCAVLPVLRWTDLEGECRHTDVS